jgi:hypothetical protein
VLQALHALAFGAAAARVVLWFFMVSAAVGSSQFQSRLTFWSGTLCHIFICLLRALISICLRHSDFSRAHARPTTLPSQQALLHTQLPRLLRFSCEAVE